MIRKLGWYLYLYLYLYLMEKDGQSTIGSNNFRIMFDIGVGE